MLASISPLGERARNQSYPVTATVYIAASTVTATAFGALLGALGRPLASTTGAIVAIVALAVFGLLFDLRVIGNRVPGPRRQVNENWLATYRGWVYGAGFGSQLGFGFATIITASATWVAFACALLSGSALRGAIIGLIFGLLRALPILANAKVHDPAGLRAQMRKLEGRRPFVTRWGNVAQAVAASGLVVVVMVGAG